MKQQESIRKIEYANDKNKTKEKLQLKATLNKSVI